MGKHFLYALALLAGGALGPVGAYAQGAPPPVAINNGAAVRVQIGDDQKLMFAAMQKVLKRDFKAAESLYTQAIALNGGNIDAYLQRGTVRREMGDEPGTASDGRAAVLLANTALAASPRDATLYYQRGMGFRLLKNFDQAQADIRTAMQQGGQPSWQTDLQAIELEKKVGN